jgi:hypothetical protein
MLTHDLYYASLLSEAVYPGLMQQQRESLGADKPLVQILLPFDL